MRIRLQRAVEIAGGQLAQAQGVAGVVCVSAGVYLRAGAWAALVVFGTFLILAALFSSLGGARR